MSITQIMNEERYIIVRVKIGVTIVTFCKHMGATTLKATLP